MVSGFGLACHVFFAVDFSLLPPLFVWLTVGAATAYLYIREEAPLGPLRLIEWWFFTGAVLAMTFQNYNLVLEGARLPIAGEAAAMTMLHWFRLCLHMALIIVAYAMFMPASWKRTLAHTLPMAAWPFAFGWWMIRAHPEVAAAAAQQADFEKVSSGALAMAAAVGIAVYGTYIIDSLRQADYERGFASQYHLEKKLGQGGMGEVWLARHNLLTRPAAIKVIRPEMLRNGGGSSGTTAINQAMKRFEREAQATATLTSPKHDRALRLRHHRRWFVLLRHGVPRWARFRHVGRETRAGFDRTNRLSTHPGLRLPRRCPRAWADPPRREASQHLCHPQRD